MRTNTTRFRPDFRGGLLVLLLGGLIAPGARADLEPDAAHRLDLSTERVVVFKDGYGLFIKRATGIADEDGRVYTDEVPDAAVLGCVWAVSESGAPAGMNAEWIETTERTSSASSCTTILELLRANAGRDVTLDLSDQTTVSGRLVEVLELPPDEPAAEGPTTAPAARTDLTHLTHLRVLPTETPAALETERELTPRGGSLFVIETADRGTLILPVGSVRSMAGAEVVTTMERVRETTTRRKRLTFDFGAGGDVAGAPRSRAAGRPVELRLMYFAPGIRWIPTYRLSGDLLSQGDLALQGELLNEVEDVDGAALDLVVGVPNFRFRDVVSPLALERTLRRTLQQAAPSIMGQGMRNTFSQRSGEWRGEQVEPFGPDEGVNLPPELTAAGRHDLFVYGLPDFSLRRGARATVALWRRSVDLRHVYTLDVNLVRNARSGSSSSVPSGGAPPDTGPDSPLRLARHEVWHQLELANRGDTPWTTGAALLMRGGLPLGQELLTYTPPGGRTLLPVTVAVDIRAAHAEREIERLPDALRWDGYTYALIRKEGTITLTNYRDEPATTRIIASFGGKAESADRGGAITVNDWRGEDWDGGQFLVNGHSDVRWEIELAPGETRELTYTCSFYVR